MFKSKANSNIENMEQISKHLAKKKLKFQDEDIVKTGE